LLEYMAIAAGFRGRGIGSALLRHILDTLRLTEHISGLILEVEPKEQGTQEEKALRKRRIQFYRKNGAHLVECAPRYRMPNLAGYGDVEMRLMWLPLREKDITLSGRKLRDCIIKIYRYCYSRSSDDPLLQTVLKDLAC
ncbi:MAG: N-acetyltransferase, partial [Chloroflexi bacterium]